MKKEKQKIDFSLPESAASAVSTLFVLVLKGPACVICQHLIAGDRAADNANANQFKSKLCKRSHGLLYSTYTDAFLYSDLLFMKKRLLENENTGVTSYLP